MTGEPLCLTCGYYVATIGDQCDTCRSGDPWRGLEAAVVASAIAWRRTLIPKTSTASAAPTAALADAVDRLIKENP